ncbi:MAG: CPBP family intramembrane metalloprotease [Gemmatimonadota bacterium]|nr:MAG: CPBP family intramembrane metalloprotease [Gemmatimonadota bacterium]
MRDLIFGREKLRALWRLLIFLALAIATFAVLSIAAGPLLPEGVDGYWSLALPSALMVAAMLFASAVMMRLVERRPLAALGFPGGSQPAADLARGMAIGGGFMALLVTLLTVVGWLRPAPDAGTFAGWLEHVAGLGLMLALAAAAEELLFRGYAFQVLVEGSGPLIAVVLSSALFAGVHVFNPEVSAIALVNIGLAGVLMAGAYLRTRSLWVAIGLHWAWNWVMAAAFDLPVSGIDFDVPGYDTLELGPDAMTGGAFGPEAGLLTTALSLPLIVWVLRTPWLRESARMAELKPLVDARELP